MNLTYTMRLYGAWVHVKTIRRSLTLRPRRYQNSDQQPERGRRCLSRRQQAVTYQSQNSPHVILLAGLTRADLTPPTCRLDLRYGRGTTEI